MMLIEFPCGALVYEELPNVRRRIVAVARANTVTFRYDKSIGPALACNRAKIDSVCARFNSASGSLADATIGTNARRFTAAAASPSHHFTLDLRQV
jgi:hypothetical protein